MVEQCGMKCIKLLLFAFNLIFFLVGLSLVILGVALMTELSAYIGFSGESSKSLCVLFIVVGVFIFIIGFFGCCGAIKENYCMVMTYAVLLGLIFILEIGGGIAAFVLRNDLEIVLKDNMEKSLPKYGESGNPETKMWDTLQKDLMCCGVGNATDWTDRDMGVPDSCCKTAHCVTNVTSNIYIEGCFDKLVQFLQDKILYIGGFGLGLALIQILGISCACIFARAVGRGYETV